MNIEEQFNLIAREYDANRRKFIPCFDDFYRNTTNFIVANIDTPKLVVDLGAGTGLLTSFWYQACPNADYILVDIAGSWTGNALLRTRSVCCKTAVLEP